MYTIIPRFYTKKKVAISNSSLLAEQQKQTIYVSCSTYGPHNENSEYSLRYRHEIINPEGDSIVHIQEPTKSPTTGDQEEEKAA